jgi:hypothetical protein
MVDSTLRLHCESFPVASPSLVRIVGDGSAVAVPSRRVDSHIPLSLAIPMTTQVGNRFAVVSMFTGSASGKFSFC